MHFRPLLVLLECSPLELNFATLLGGTTCSDYFYMGSLGCSFLFPNHVNLKGPNMFGTCKPFSSRSMPQQLIKVTQKQLLQNTALFIHPEVHSKQGEEID